MMQYSSTAEQTTASKSDCEVESAPATVPTKTERYILHEGKIFCIAGLFYF